MEHIVALLFVVGCSSTMTDCRELEVPVSVFEIAQACVAERPFALGDLQGQAPRIIGKCLAVDPALEDDYDQIVWNVKSDGTLAASLEVSRTLLASNREHPEKDYVRQQ
ncbi:hypothetical protein LB572_30765 [Mesorhizobium sp. BH1-1-5]|uniref:hypothetical protein n=1 Tax=Mesorhizobium sp. BH1-1-5 TaxID=2876661 RepID=UPI001CCE7796|nr:hypothetical protein [Mesorhizobium sp. BH1-1-5]MBZ9991480.1 hypothetical protein [Mesorhizobium sp. BH1-1-5]